MGLTMTLADVLGEPSQICLAIITVVRPCVCVRPSVRAVGHWKPSNPDVKRFVSLQSLTSSDTSYITYD